MPEKLDRKSFVRNDIAVSWKSMVLYANHLFRSSFQPAFVNVNLLILPCECF